MIEVLRLGHRISRDKRISTHVALVARAFGASKLYYTGQKDSDYEKSVSDVVKDFGGDFNIEYVKSWKELFKGKTVVHLTMYGLDYREEISKVKGDILIVVGGEKVEWEVYTKVDFNLAVTNQPHSEVGALAVFLDHLTHSNYKKFDGKIKIKPSAKGKEFF
nr:tRNA (cytidine(56)-2'-O)-methyltransferase [Nanoarchaeum sp.]